MEKVKLNNVKNKELVSIRKEYFTFLKLYKSTTIIMAFRIDAEVTIETSKINSEEKFFFEKRDNRLFPVENLSFKIFAKEMDLYIHEKEFQTKEEDYYFLPLSVDILLSDQLGSAVLENITEQDLAEKRDAAATRSFFEYSAVYRDLILDIQKK